MDVDVEFSPGNDEDDVSPNIEGIIARAEDGEDEEEEEGRAGETEEEEEDEAWNGEEGNLV